MITLITGEINFKGNNEFYDQFLKCKKKFNPPYNMEISGKNDEDITIDFAFSN